MSKTKKIAILAIIAMVLTMMPASLFAVDFDGDRIQGADRYATALAIAEAGWDTADAVVLAAGENNHLVDALAAAPLAGQENAPILLTPKAALKAEVKAAIEDLGAKTVYVVGAVSDAVVAEVEALGVDVEKLSGADRWATADAINAELDAPAGTFVVGYNAVADAMSAASYAAANGFKIVLAKADGSVDADALVGDVYIVGGEKWVKDIDGAERLAGADRFATNAKVAEGLEFDFGKVYVANGISLVDALAVAPLAAMDDAFVLLCSASDVDVLDGFKASTQFIAVGGTNAVPNKILDKLAGEDSGEFTVKSVKAPNLIQVVLELSNDNYFDKDALTEAGNYTFKGDAQGDSRNKAVEIDVDPSLDGTTVTLTLDTAVENQSEGTLVIDSAVTGEELKFEGIEFFDSSIPEIKDVKVIGKNIVKFVFSEPIKDEANKKSQFEFTLDGKRHGVNEVNFIKNGYEANVKVFGTFSEGTLTVKVKNGLEDYAGFNIIANTYEVEVVKDTEAPYVVGYKNAKKDKVTLIFNEDIQHESKDRNDFYHTNSRNIIDNDAAIFTGGDDDTAKIDGNELTLKFGDNKLPDGTSYVYVSTGAVADLWGNENNSIKVTIEIDADKVKPEVKSVEYKSNNTIVVTFTEEVDEDTAEESDNYTLVDADGDKVSLRTPVLDSKGKKVSIELRDSDPDKGTYELTIEKVEDLAGNRMDKATFDVEIGDTGAPEFPTTVYFDNEGDDLIIFVEFAESMAVDGSYSVADLYKYDVTFGSKTYNLGKANADDLLDVDIDVTDNDKTVKITIEDANKDSKQTPSKVVIARVADAEGNVTEAVSQSYDTTGVVVGGETYIIKNINDATLGIKIKEVKATNNTTLEVKFEGNLDYFEIEDFFIAGSDNKVAKNADGKEYVIADLEVKEANKIILTVDDDAKLPANVSGLFLNTLAKVDEKNVNESENSYGIKLGAGQHVPIEDKIKPGVKKYNDQDTNATKPGTKGTKDGVAAVYATYDSTARVVTLPTGTTVSAAVTKVTVEFTEELRAITESLIVVNDGDNKVISVDATDNGATGTLVFYVTGELVRGDDVDISIIYDTVGNYVKDVALQVEFRVDTGSVTVTP